MASTGQAGTLMLVTHGRGLAQGVLQERHEGVGSLDAVATRLACVDHDVVDEHLPHARPVLGVHGAEVARLQPPDRLDVVHVDLSVCSAERGPEGLHPGVPFRWLLVGPEVAGAFDRDTPYHHHFVHLTSFVLPSAGCFAWLLHSTG